MCIKVSNWPRRILVFFLVCFILIGSIQLVNPVIVKASTFNVSDYGAVPDDTGDDGSAIRAAVDAAIVGGNGSILSFSSGEYRLGPAPDAWEYNTDGNIEEWTMENQVSGSVSGGTLNLTVNGTDPYIKSPDHLMIDAGYITVLYVMMKNNTSASSANVQWIKQDDTTWDASKSYTFEISSNDSAYKTYAIPVGLNSNWSNTVRQIRIHPEEGASTGTVNIDYIRLGATTTYMTWNFNWEDNFESWVMQNECSGSVFDGILQISISDTDPYIYSPDNMDFTDVGCVKIKMKNNTSDTSARLYYITNDDTVWDIGKSVIFPINANDSNYSVYYIDLYNIAALSGKTIKRLRIDPIDGGSINSGTVNIDYIDLQNQNRSDVRKYAIRCDGSSGLTFQGAKSGGSPQTTLLITDMLLGAITLDNNTNISVTGLTIDYLNPPYTQGTISAIDTANTTIDYVPETGYTDILDDLRFTSYLSHPQYGSFYGFARDSNNPNIMMTTGGDAIFFSNMVKLNSTTWRFTITNATRLGSPELTANTKFVITPRSSGANAFLIRKNNGVALSDINIYASPEAGVILHTNKDSASFAGVKILRKPSSTRWLSTNADGFHFQASKKGAVMDGCLIQGCGDDLLNFYIIPSRLVKVISSTKIVVESTGPECPAVGDSIQVFNPQTGDIRGTAKVTSWDAGSTSKFAVLNLSQAISGMVAGTSYSNCDAVLNLTYAHPNYSISNSTFEDGRRYGLFLKAIHGTVKNCTFNNLAGCAIIGEPEFGNYTEGPAIDTIMISGCTINNCAFYRQDNYQDHKTAAIKIMGSKLNYALGDGRSQKNITISGTMINSVNAKNAIYIGSAENVNIIGNNVIKALSTDYDFGGDIAGVRLENVNNALIDNLSVIDPRSLLKAGILISNSSKINIGTLNFQLASNVPDISKVTSFLASTGFSGTQGQNQWYYQEWNGSNYSNMSYNTGGYWQGTATNTRIGSGWQHPDMGYDSVRKWVAPKPGKVSISGSITKNANGNGVIVKILKNATELWSSTITTAGPIDPSGVSDIDVNTGDALYFIVNNNGNTAFDGTNWNQNIEMKEDLVIEPTTFTAMDGFSGLQGGNQWYYQQWNGSNYSDMLYDSVYGYWKGSTSLVTIDRSWHHPDAGYDSVRKWIVPCSGIISISGSVAKGDNYGNGVVATILKNTTQLWSSTITSTIPVSPANVSDIAVNAGDAIYFIVNSNGDATNDTTSWNPTISLILSSSYKASTGFGSVQGGNQWYYQQWNGSSYSDMVYDSVNGFWQGTPAWTRVYVNWQHPDTGYDSVRKWVAPRAGTVNITGEVYKSDNYGNGVFVQIIKNSTQLWSSTITSTTHVTPTGVDNIVVNEGDALYFIVNNNGNTANDATNWNPQINMTFSSIYHSIQGFSSIQGTNQWYYQQWDGTSYSDLTYNAGGYWQGNAAWTRVYDSWQHPDAGYDSVRKWVAPRDGTVSIAGVLYKSDNNGNGVVAKILKNSSQLWSSIITSTTPVGPTGVSDITVSAGDALYFIVNNNGNTTFDGTHWEPIVILK